MRQQQSVERIDRIARDAGLCESLNDTVIEKHPGCFVENDVLDILVESSTFCYRKMWAERSAIERIDARVCEVRRVRAARCGIGAVKERDKVFCIWIIADPTCP